MIKKISLILLISCTFCLLALAHEYLLLASNYRVNKGDKVAFHLFVADGFNIEAERPFQKNKTTFFKLYNHQSTINLLDSVQDGDLPIYSTTIPYTGLGLYVMNRNFTTITLEPNKFLEYLKEDNIDNIKPTKQQLQKPQREIYTRYIKCLLQSNAEATDTIYKCVTGQQLEIVLLQNPYIKKIGEELPVKILYNNLPLVNKVVIARNRIGNQAPTRQLIKTDDKGIALLKITRKGEWFIHLTHMITSSVPKEADWESFWASFSFGL